MKKRTKKLALAAGIFGALTLGGVTAYLTDYDSAVNEFTVGKVDIELQEPDWKPEEHETMEPGDEIEKDPQIQNTGVNDAFVYLEVSIPRADVIAADTNGTRLDKKEQELFSFEASTSWTKLEERVSGSNMIYVYTYNKILEPQETTEALFEQVNFLNIIEGQLDTQQLEIPVRAYAIQTAHTGDNAGSVIKQATAAYQKYVNQNLGDDGQVTE